MPRRSWDTRIRRLAAGVFAVAEEVGHQTVGAGDALGKLAVEGEGAVDVGPFADGGDEEAAALRILAGVVGFKERGVLRGPVGGEAVTAFFNPPIEICGRDAVWPGEERCGGGEEGNGLLFLDDVVGGVSGERVGEGRGGGVEAAGVVLGNDYAACGGIVEEGFGAGAGEFGVGGVGADAEEDGVVLLQVGEGEIFRCEQGWSDAKRGEEGGDVVSGAGKVGDVEVGGGGDVDGDRAEGGGGIEVGVGEAGVADGAVALGVERVGTRRKGAIHWVKLHLRIIEATL